MVKLLIILVFDMVFSDIFNIESLRKLLYSFLLSKHNIQGAKKIHDSQPLKDRVLLKYVENYAIYQKQFKFLYKFWIVYISMLSPRYIFAILFLTSSNTIEDKVIVFFIIFLINIVIFIFLRLHFRNHVSVFDKRCN